MLVYIIYYSGIYHFELRFNYASTCNSRDLFIRITDRPQLVPICLLVISYLSEAAQLLVSCITQLRSIKL